MTTNLSDVYTRFFDELENDKRFFDYYNNTAEQSMALATERAHSYLKSAVLYMRRRCNLEFTLRIERVEDTEQFVEEITDDEVELLAKIMTLCYYERKKTELTPIVNAFSAADLKTLYSPASERSSYLALVAEKTREIELALADYQARDRLTMKHKSITYELPVEEEIDG